MDNKQANICYLLGAGASYNALPIVNEIPIELEKMMDYISNFEVNQSNTNYQIVRSKLSNFYSKLVEIKAHNSIDTLARKYWLKRQSYLVDTKEYQYWDKEYEYIKRIISCLLTYRRLNFSKTENFSNEITSFDNKNRLVQKLDPRYDSLLASILTFDFHLPENISIISWNYDLQLEQAFSFYQDQNDLIEVGKNLNIGYETKENSQILKLNGTAWFNPSGTIQAFYNYDFESHTVFWNALKDSNDPLIKTGIKFSWENDNLVDHYRRSASEKIAEADFIIAIGYSFPIFNRQTDIQIFSKLNPKAKIIIQCPQEHGDRLITQMDSIKSGISSKTSVVGYTDQFYLPNQYWQPNKQNSLRVL
ncbi:MAG: hypothetical protein MH472_03460 [Bacteroidia bacterium]|nr:hypothetical protein [Bacteroidia bacterium]